MNIDLFYTALLIGALVLPAFVVYLYMLRKQLSKQQVASKQQLDNDLIKQKLIILSKELALLEKRNKMMEDQILNMTASLVSYEKVLTTLLTTQVPGGHTPDGTIH